ncbi:MAG: 7-cyano-7-deazaguanine synthase QueC [Bacteroidota bacterium]
MGASPVVVLVSGGMDSCVTAAIAAQEHPLALLHVRYGQRTQHREERAFHAIADFYRAPHRLVITLGHLAEVGGSSLTDPRIPLERGIDPSRSIPLSYVPFRNANLLAAAVSWAEVLGAEAVYIGAVEEDSSGYPDCRTPFFRAFEEAVRAGTRPATRIAIRTPVLSLSKAEIVREGLRLGAPLDLTWSCYEREDEACGVCASCTLRLRGFRLAGSRDSIPYAVHTH